MARTPHDRFAQRVFSDPRHAAVVFRAVLPAALVGQLDFEAAELLPRLFTDQELQERRSDFSFRVPLGSGEAYLLALLEHQSAVDPLMAARTLVYLGRALDRHLREHPGCERVPALIPVVLHHGPGGWTAPTELLDLYDVPAALLPALRDLAPNLRYRVDDLDPADDEVLRDRPGPVLPAWR